MDFSALSNKEIKRLSKAMQDAGLSELEVQEGEARIRLRIGQDAPTAVATAPTQVVQQETAPAATEAPEASQPAQETLDAPMVGTFYHAASPEAEAFVKVGDAVTVGQTIGIVEAMKTMNHVTAEKAGTVAEILVADGTGVQFGAPLMALKN